MAMPMPEKGKHQQTTAKPGSMPPKPNPMPMPMKPGAAPAKPGHGAPMPPKKK